VVQEEEQDQLVLKAATQCFQPSRLQAVVVVGQWPLTRLLAVQAVVVLIILVVVVGGQVPQAQADRATQADRPLAEIMVRAVVAPPVWVLMAVLFMVATAALEFSILSSPA
jgi:hypothetical protein